LAEKREEQATSPDEMEKGDPKDEEKAKVILSFPFRPKDQSAIDPAHRAFQIIIALLFQAIGVFVSADYFRPSIVR